MPLTIGTRIGSYDVLDAIGAGGMGEVYRARDSRLNRHVALKILPDAFAMDADRLARFRREAQVLASLNHPNIAQIYGIEDAGGVHALVLELVEGPTLADRITEAPMALAEALPVAKQIAEALEAAHEHGIIHRDLKPANIKVREDGTVKVLDFGLAKALDPASTSSVEARNSPTLTERATQLGVILGTAAYMSPEQAKGKAVDRRADIWAFGAVLYEMLSGQRAFKGEDVSDTLASVLRQDVDWSALPASTPAALRRLIARCLERDPKRRLRDIGEARLALEDPAAAETTAAASAAPVVAPTSRGHRALPWMLAGGLAAALGAVLLQWAPWQIPAPGAPLRFNADIGVTSTLDMSGGSAAVLSPDGRMLAFLAIGPLGRQIFVRKLDQLQAVPLDGTDGAAGLFFSPDGQWIGFHAAGKLKKIAATGGAAVTLCSAATLRGASWADDDTIVFQPNLGGGGLVRVQASGGVPVPLVAMAGGEVVQRYPQVLPGGKAVLYTANAAGRGFEAANLMVQPLPAGQAKVVIRGGFSGRYTRSGHLIYVRDSTLFAVPFDLERLEVRGQPAPVFEGVLTNTILGFAHLSVSDTGTLVYSRGTASDNSRPMLWMDQTGATAPLRAAPADWVAPRFSPDGRKLAMEIRDGGQSDVWVYDWARDTLTKFTFGPAADGRPVWSPDGRRIVFGSDRASSGIFNLYWQRADGTGDVQRLTESPQSQTAYSFHSSGKFLAFSEGRAGTTSDLMILPLEGDETTGWKPGTPTVFLSTPSGEFVPTFSPDDRWIAYMSDESGIMQVYVRPFPGPGGKWQIATGVGIYPVWSRTRQELLFADFVAAKIMVAPYIVEGGSFVADKPRMWSPTSYSQFSTAPVYDLHPDGRRMAITKAAETDAEKRNKVVFVLNFFDELRRVAPARP